MICGVHATTVEIAPAGSPHLRLGDCFCRQLTEFHGREATLIKSKSDR